MNKTIIIAEAGVNHNGDIKLAKKLIDAAAEAGVEYVKFQTFKTELLVSKNAKKADYQIKNQKSNDDSQYNMLKKLELAEDTHYELLEYCKLKNVKFLSTAFDFESIDFLAKLGIDFFKIPSGELTNYPYLKRIAKKQLPVVISTGMANLDEIKNALEVFKTNDFYKNNKNITVLHCSSEYPTPMNVVNLSAMNTIKSELNVNIGYSDHTLGIEIPIAAVAMGAKIIEKHFTLDKTLPGPDHKASLDPIELKNMVKAIRNIEQAIGNGKKIPNELEIKNKPLVRKSIIALKNIKKGEVLSENNITTKRPGTGLNPFLWDSVIGTKAIKDFLKDEIIVIN